MPFDFPVHTAFHKKTMVTTVTTGTSGSVAMTLYFSGVNSRFNIDVLAPSHTVASNTYTASLEVPEKQSSDHFISGICARFRYIGPLLDRGGVAYIVDAHHGLATTDTT